MSDNKLIVWGIGTSRTVRVLWTLLELGLDYEHHPIGSRTGETLTDEYTRLNPKQKIPTLVHGSLVLTESAAIIHHLTRVFLPPADFYVPIDPVAAARLDEWCYFIMSELDAHSLYLIRRHEGLPHIYGEAPHAVASAREYFLKQAHAIADRADKAGHYLLGERFSIADILMMSCLDWAKLYHIELPQELRNYHRRLAQRPNYQRIMRINYPQWFTDGGLIPEPLRPTLNP